MGKEMTDLLPCPFCNYTEEQNKKEHEEYAAEMKALSAKTSANGHVGTCCYAGPPDWKHRKPRSVERRAKNEDGFTVLHYDFECQNCEVYFEFCEPTKQEAITRWNTRE